MESRREKDKSDRSGTWIVLLAEIKSLFSLFHLAKPRLRGDTVAPSTNVKGIKWGGEKV